MENKVFSFSGCISENTSLNLLHLNWNSIAKLSCKFLSLCLIHTTHYMQLHLDWQKYQNNSAFKSNFCTCSNITLRYIQFSLKRFPLFHNRLQIHILRLHWKKQRKEKRKKSISKFSYSSNYCMLSHFFFFSFLHCEELFIT